MASAVLSKLVYIMGASGAGKDSLIGFVRTRATAQNKLVFAHRYITRPAEINGENHISLTEEEFEIRESAGCFAMSWQAHGNRYAVGVEIDHWLNAGLTVVMNGSRAYLEKAQQQYTQLTPVLISVSEEKLKSRLLGRGRECIEEISERIERANQFEQKRASDVHTITNDSALADAGDQLYQYLNGNAQ